MRELAACALALTLAPIASAGWVERLDDPDPEVRRLAAWSLRETPVDRSAARRLVDCLADDDALTARYCATTVAGHEAAIEPLIERLVAGERRFLKVDALLTEFGEPASAPLLAAFEAHDERGARTRIAKILGEIGPQSAAAVPALVAALEASTSAGDARHYAVALGQIGSLEPVLEAWPRVDGFRRTALHIALSGFGARAAPAVPLLLSALEESPTANERSTAAVALGTIGQASAEGVPTLLRLAREDESATVRGYAITALGEIGARSDEVLPLLVATLGSDDATLRRRAGRALAQFGDAAMPALQESATDARESVRAETMAALRQMESDRSERIEALIEGCGDESEKVAKAALLGLLKDGAAALAAVRQAAKRHPSDRVRGYAVLFLGTIEVTDDESVPVLLKAMDDEALRVRQIAAWSLGKHGRLAASAARQLVTALGSGDALLARNAAWALGSIRVASPDTLTALEVAAESEDTSLREEALEALAKLRGTYTEGGL